LPWKRLPCPACLPPQPGGQSRPGSIGPSHELFSQDM